MAVITLAGPLAVDLQHSAATGLRHQGHDVEVFPVERREGIDPDRLARTEVLCTTGLRCDRALLAAAPRLRAIVTPFLGVDMIDVAAATDAGVLVARGGAPEHYQSMAEATILLALAACFDLPASLAGLSPWGSQGGPQHRRIMTGRKVGILGYGSIARDVIGRLSCWNVELLVHNRTPPADLPAGARSVGFDELFTQSDIVILLIALGPETRHIVDARALGMMKEDAILVNTARGALVDEAALVEWLRERPARRAALDVFEVEPLPVDSSLRGLPNAVMTPHCVGLTSDAASGIMRQTIENLLTVSRGEVPAATVNPVIADAWRAGTKIARD